MPAALTDDGPHTVGVRRAGDRAPLDGSPRIVTATAFDEAARLAFGQAVAEAHARAQQPQDLDRTIELLLREASRLIARRAELRG
jgi:hypothetical protein